MHTAHHHIQSHLHYLSNKEHASEADVLSRFEPPFDEYQKYKTIIDAMYERTWGKIRRCEFICAIVDDSSSCTFHPFVVIAQIAFQRTIQISKLSFSWCNGDVVVLRWILKAQLMKGFLLNTFLCRISDDSSATDHIIKLSIAAVSKCTAEPLIIHHEFLHHRHLLFHCSSRICSEHLSIRRSIRCRWIEILSE